MQNRMNKKGFTIVELVIVIAVIAVLAAVLIPTFVSLVNKANQSSDIQAARQMNEVLAGGVDGVAPENVEDAIKILVDAGFRANDILLPVSADHQFYWYKTKNVVVLVDGDNKIVYPEEYAEVDPSDAEQFFGFETAAVKYVPVEAGDVTSLEEALSGGFADITLTEDVKLETQVLIPTGSKVTLDLNGKTLTTEQVTGRSKYLDVKGELTIVNGTIEARGIEVLNGGKLIIGKDANVVVSNVDANGGAAVWVEPGAEVVINGGTFTALNGNANIGADGSQSQNPSVIFKKGGKVTINGGTFKSVNSYAYCINAQKGETIINGGTFESAHGVVCSYTGKVTINGGTFKLVAMADGSFSGHNVYNPESNTNAIIVNGGEFISEDPTPSIFYGNVEDKRG